MADLRINEIDPVLLLDLKVIALNGQKFSSSTTTTNPLTANQTQAVAFAENSRSELRLQNDDGSVAGSLKVAGGKPGQGYPAVMLGLSVRRLTPKECERLQGFPDDYTNVIYRNKPAADGPRYKSLGNSMAVPVMRWILRRIDMVDGSPS